MMSEIRMAKHMNKVVSPLCLGAMDPGPFGSPINPALVLRNKDLNISELLSQKASPTYCKVSLPLDLTRIR